VGGGGGGGEDECRGLVIIGDGDGVLGRRYCANVHRCARVWRRVLVRTNADEEEGVQMVFPAIFSRRAMMCLP